MNPNQSHSEENKAGVAVLAAGIACFIFGIMTILVENIESVKHSLQWSKSVGPLSGEVGVAVIAWFISWLVLVRFYENKAPMGSRLFQIGLALILLSFLFTFPPFFDLFS